MAVLASVPRSIEPGRAYTLEEIAEMFGITRERVRQIETVALAKIRRELQKDPQALKELAFEIDAEVDSLPKVGRIPKPIRHRMEIRPAGYFAPKPRELRT